MSWIPLASRKDLVLSCPPLGMTSKFWTWVRAGPMPGKVRATRAKSCVSWLKAGPQGFQNKYYLEKCS